MGDRHQRIYKAIRERISLLYYPPNTVIGETELAGKFNVSHTPIRRVLQRLHFEGLVDIRNGVGTVVTDIGLKTMKEVYDLRMYLSELIAEPSPHEITKDHLQAMELLLERTKTMMTNVIVAPMDACATNCMKSDAYVKLEYAASVEIQRNRNI